MFVTESPHPPRASGPQSDSSELPLEHLEHEIEQLAAHLNAGKAQWLELVAEFDRREGWGKWRCRSCAEWIAWRCALDPRSAREHVRVARRLAELPLTREAFSRGELSFSKVRALTRIAEPDTEEDLLELARHATAAQLERIVRATRRATAAQANENYRESFLSWSWDEHGCLCFSGRLPAEDGAQFLRALEACRDAIGERAAEDRGSAEPREGAAKPPDNGSAEPSAAPSPPPVPTNAEAVVAMSEAALARPPTGRPAAERHQVLIHIDADSLPVDDITDPDGECAIADGPGLAPEAVRRLLCDGSFVPIVERGGETLSVGRRTRTIPAALRRALIARDGRCQYPGCERWRFVDAHHIEPWALGGETTLENLILLCRHHHRFVHEGGAHIVAAADGRPRFYAPDGTELLAPAPPGSAPGRLEDANRSRGSDPTAGTILTGTGERMDFRLCVDAALSAGSWLRTSSRSR
jgi:Domain of unknown function (DUF222)/HNH endonuclease